MVLMVFFSDFTSFLQIIYPISIIISYGHFRPSLGPGMEGGNCVDIRGGPTLPLPKGRLTFMGSLGDKPNDKEAG